MTELEKAQLEEIAEKLVGTLGDMPSKQADFVVTEQVKAIYAVLGYETKVYVIKDEPHVSLRLC